MTIIACASHILHEFLQSPEAVNLAALFDAATVRLCINRSICFTRCCASSASISSRNNTVGGMESSSEVTSPGRDTGATGIIEP